MSTPMPELTVAIRGLFKRPLFTLIAVATIALGVGANTTLFSVVNALLLRAPPGVPDAAQVVELGRTRDGRGFDTFSTEELRALQELGGPLEQVAGVRTPPVSFSTGGEGERLMSFAASHNYFSILGVRPALGRFYTTEEDRIPNGVPVVVLSDAFWRTRFGGSTAVIGQSITLNRRDFTVIGVTPPGFVGHVPQVQPEVYIPLAMMSVAQPGFSAFDYPNSSWVQAIGRLRSGATEAQANEAVVSLFARRAEADPEFYRGRSAAAKMLGGFPAGGRAPATAFLGILMGVVGMILLVACANVAGMLIARAAAREREIAIRLALGAGRGRLIRQLLIETLVLFVIGGAAGVVLSYWTTTLLASINLPTPIPIVLEFAPDARVIAFGLAVAFTTGLIFGLAPALQATRPDLVPLLKSDSARSGSAGGRLRRVFIAGQVALTVALLIASGLFLRALQRAGGTDPGFSADDAAVISFNLSLDGYDEARGRMLQRTLLERLAATPGAVGVGLATDLPLDLSASEAPVFPEGWQGADPNDGLMSAFVNVRGEYFKALNIEVQRGRALGANDVAESAPVAVVSRGLAQLAWPNLDPIGKKIRWGGNDEVERTVVGVVADVKNQMLMEETGPMIYLPLEQQYTAELYAVLRSSAGANAAASALQRVLREVDPQLSTAPVQTMSDYAALGLLPQRLAAFITTGFGTLALLLSAIGVYGVIAFMVAQRTREIGIRIALGADRRKVVRLVVWNGLRLALPGALFGAAMGLGIGFLLRSFILGVPPTDLAAIVGAPVVLVLAVLIACWVPAARAAAVDPGKALRAE